MSDYNTKKNPQSAVAVDEERRSFLRKSIYAAYATPLITALLVEEASAKKATTMAAAPKNGAATRTIGMNLAADAQLPNWPHKNVDLQTIHE